jgi:hypothetical protein
VAAVCWKCVEDEYLKEIVREKGQPDQCSICDGDQENAFTASDIADLLDPIMQEHFTQGPEVKKFGQDDTEWYEQEGDPLSFHMQEVIGQYLGFEDEIAEALVDNEDVWEPDGDIPFFDSTADYVSKPIYPYAYYEQWAYALEDLKHRRRFFSSAAASLFERLFEGVDTRKSWSSETRANQDVVWELPTGSDLFRARVCGSFSVEDAYKEPLKYVGPPPADRTRTGRMNVEGVPIFYGATDCETCLAEVRPALGSEVVAIKLQTTKPLRVLDFTRLEKSYSRLSYFQPDFNEQAEKGSFLRRLQSLISQPIVPGREPDYLITQTMTEYLAYVHNKPFDGILFRSVQRAKGVNAVLFPDSAGTFPISYADKSFKLFTTRSISYTHGERHVGLMDDGAVWIGSEPEEEWGGE